MRRYPDTLCRYHRAQFSESLNQFVPICIHFQFFNHESPPCFIVLSLFNPLP